MQYNLTEAQLWGWLPGASPPLAPERVGPLQNEKKEIGEYYYHRSQE